MNFIKELLGRVFSWLSSTSSILNREHCKVWQSWYLPNITLLSSSISRLSTRMTSLIYVVRWLQQLLALMLQLSQNSQLSVFCKTSNASNNNFLSPKKCTVSFNLLVGQPICQAFSFYGPSITRARRSWLSSMPSHRRSEHTRTRAKSSLFSVSELWLRRLFLLASSARRET